MTSPAPSPPSPPDPAGPATASGPAADTSSTAFPASPAFHAPDPPLADAGTPVPADAGTPVAADAGTMPSAETPSPGSWGPPPSPPPGTPGPPPGPPGTPAPPEAPGAAEGTNRFAVWSLVTGLLTPCGGIPGVASVILGIVALREIRRRRQSGAGLAIGGLVATGVWSVLIVLGGVAVAATMLLNSTATPTAIGPSPAPTPAVEPSPDRTPAQERQSDPREVTEAELVSVFDLEVGYCIEDLWSDAVGSSVSVVPCSDPHDGQVYALFDLPDGVWPGADPVEDEAFSSCYDILEDNFPQATRDEWLDYYAIYPTRFTWRDGDREVACLTLYLDDQRTGSLFDDDDYPQSVSGNSGGSGT